jgi:septal ring factor EnvC (AmiA/AmiB activator)
MVDSSHYRRQTVAAMDASIAQAEQVRAERLEELQRLIAAGRNTRRTTVFLKLAEQRLEQLRRSRTYLVDVEPTKLEPIHRPRKFRVPPPETKT